MKENEELFLYGKIRNKSKAIYYCELHKCYVSKKDLFERKFKCNKCKHKKEL